MAITDGEWSPTVANLLQVLVGALCGYVPLQRVYDALADMCEPRNQSERYFFLWQMSDLLLDVVLGRKRVLRLDVLERILDAWPSVRHQVAPLSALRRALNRSDKALATTESHLADRIHDMLEQRYAERLLLKNIVRELGVSESKASRCFRAIYRSTIHQHLLVIRVKRGLTLVRQGAKIESVALAVGFRSKKDFYRAVQKFAGCTPAQFRRTR